MRRETKSKRARAARPSIPVRVAVLTVSDQGAAGQRVDTSGDAIVAWATRKRFTVSAREIVPDEARIVERIFREFIAGVSPKQIAKNPDVTTFVAQKRHELVNFIESENQGDEYDQGNESHLKTIFFKK